MPHETQEEPRVTPLRLPAEGEPCVEVCQNSSKRTYAMKIVSTTKTPEITYLKHTVGQSRGYVRPTA